MAGFALGQTPEDIYTGAESWIQPAVMPPQGGSGWAGSILDTIISTGTGLIKSITQPDVVKSAMDKFVFGRPAVMPPLPGQPGYILPGTSSQWIAGVPNLYLIIGGAAVLFLVMKKGR